MNHQDNNPDIFGKAIKAYFETGSKEPIVVHSPDFEDDIIPVDYLFRSFRDMPPIEQKALDLARGKVLDVGCGAGSHALYLQERNISVTAIDSSEGAVEICHKRGLTDVRQEKFGQTSGSFDTILLLMNGTGIIGQMKNLDHFFATLKKLLRPGGQVLIDSTDLIYLFDKESDGGVWIDAGGEYYGEMEYRLSHGGKISRPFRWLYLDFDTLSLAAAKNGFSCTRIAAGAHYDYLARLTIQPTEEHE